MSSENRINNKLEFTPTIETLQAIGFCKANNAYNFSRI